MCGIAGFSLAPDSNIKVRQLANSLLTAIEDRGSMASGYAYQVGSHMGYHKSATPGSKLGLKRLPKDARHVILHTRLATHGSITDNRNNHPVVSPSENIALVHNGVIYNHEEVRLKVDGHLPDVDTSVIPAVIEQLGVESIDVLDGDAAIAWFDRKQHDTLHLARYQHSPLVMCQTEDGSFIFASTEDLLWRVLIQLEIVPTWMEKANELEYFTIRDGVILSKQMLPAPKYTDSRYDYTYYRHQTSGAKGSYSIYGNSYVEGYGYDYWDEDDEYWDYGVPLRELRARGAKQDSCSVPLFEDAEVIDFADEYAKRRAKWYVTLKDDNDPEPFTIFYLEDEVKEWKDELYILAQESGIRIVDYGSVKRGELVSAEEDIF